MQANRMMLIGIGGFVLGVLLSMLFGASERAEREAEQARHAELTSGLDAVATTASSLETRVDELHQRIAGIEESVGDVGSRFESLETAVADVESATSDRIETLNTRIEGVGERLSGAVSDVGSRVAGLSGAVSDVGSRMAGMAERAMGRGAAEDAETGEADAPAAAAAQPEPGAGTALGIGQTATFEDGDLRVFLSAADAQSGTARLAVNGPAAVSVALNEPVTVGECTVTLTGFTEGGATVTGSCGAAQAAEVGAGAGTEIGVGQTATFADGAARVFLSSAAAETGSARVAINGTDTRTLELGTPVTVGDCEVTLTGFTEAGGATVSADCGAAAEPEEAAAEPEAAEPEAEAAAPAEEAAEPESEAAAAQPEAEEADAGDATAAGDGTATLRIGETATLADGALRVFLAFVDPEAGTARVSAGGTGILQLSLNEPAEAGDCSVVLTEVGDGSATVEGRC